MTRRRLLSLRGLVSAIRAVDDQVPSDVSTLAIDKTPDATALVPLGLLLIPPFGGRRPVSNVVTVYVK